MKEKIAELGMLLQADYHNSLYFEKQKELGFDLSSRLLNDNWSVVTRLIGFPRDNSVEWKAYYEAPTKFPKPTEPQFSNEWLREHFDATCSAATALLMNHDDESTCSWSDVIDLMKIHVLFLLDEFEKFTNEK